MDHRRAELPLDSVAVRQANSAFYAKHPEFVQNGKRIPLNPDDPAQAGLRSEWMGLYFAKTKAKGSNRPPDRKPDETSVSCCGALVVRVVDRNNMPVESAKVQANGMAKLTDASGYADFGSVPAASYQIAASKDLYGPIAVYPDRAEVPPLATTLATLGLRKCITSRLAAPKLIARGSAGLIPPVTSVNIAGSIGGPLTLAFGQDYTFGSGGTLAAGVSVGSTETDLKAKMSKLLDDFAWDDSDKKADKEYKAFFSKKSTPEIYTDPNLNKAVPYSDKFKDFPAMALAAPPVAPLPGKVRIHQALKAAGWDINAVTPITDLGMAALNAGDNPGLYSKSTKDRANGLFTLINTIQHVLVFAESYEFDSCKQEYTIQLVLELYDMFGLDDEDIRKYGYRAAFDPKNHTEAAKGITAWWQLQHQFGYAPLITKVVVRPAPFKIPAK